MTIDVVIPARNEAPTIGAIVEEFCAHVNIGRVIVPVDADTTDDTHEVATAAGALSILPDATGKGQVAWRGLMLVDTERVIFCDADLRGLTQDHITHLAHPCDDAMILGVPDPPDVSRMPARAVDRLLWSWPWVTGQRSLPTALVRSIKPPLHGYLMETQINRAVSVAGCAVLFERLRGLVSPFNLSASRLAAMERDRLWAIREKILL